MINTEKIIEELPQIIIDANAHIERSSLLESIVIDLQKLYTSRKNLRLSTEVTVTGAGLKFILKEKENTFTDFTKAMEETINAKITEKETEIQNILSGNEAVKA